MADTQPPPKRQRPNPSTSHKKLPRLPKNATLQKRPLNRPPIPSPYASASTQKIVYISPRTPFLSAVKRVESLLALADKRFIQAATTLAQTQRKSRKRSYGQRQEGGEDEVGAIAGIVEERKRMGGRGEEVVVKGAGKAVGRVMEVGMWFQGREGYGVQVRTGTVGAVDQVEVDEREEEGDGGVKVGEGMDVDDARAQAEDGEENGGINVNEGGGKKEEQEAKVGARVRLLSVLEVAVSLR